MFTKTIAHFLLAISSIILAGNYQSKAQLPDYRQLAESLRKGPSDTAGVPLIIDHLERSGTTEPLEELVRWAQTGFPEFHDANNVWRINAGGFHGNFENALYYYVANYEASEKGARYLRLIEELRKYGQFTHPLTQSAHRFLSAEELEKEFYRLIELKDPEERARGFVLGRAAAERNKDVAFIYLKSLRTDMDMRVRYSALGTIGTLRPDYSRDIALAGLDRLLYDPEKQIREFGGVIVQQSANNQKALTERDALRLLTEMVRSKDPEVRRVLAMAAGIVTAANGELRINEYKWNEDVPHERFIRLVTAREGELKRKLDDDELVELWKQWWTPLIEVYTLKISYLACG